MASRATIRWRDEPEGDDYPAALAYLSLTFKPKVANAFVQKLRDAKVTKFEAKDVFRASDLPALGVDNSHVKKDRKSIHDGKSLAPLLLVRMPELGCRWWVDPLAGPIEN